MLKVEINELVVMINQHPVVKNINKRKLYEENRMPDVGALDRFIHRQLVKEHVKDNVEEQEHVEVEVEDVKEQENVKELVNICDLTRWEKVNYKNIKPFVENGTKEDTSIMYGPYNIFGI